jgi:small nuclear ribonucleoprotein (snRNP)-like protein
MKGILTLKNIWEGRSIQEVTISISQSEHLSGVMHVYESFSNLVGKSIISTATQVFKYHL